MKKMIKNNGFLISMLTGIIAGCVVGLLFPVVRQGDDLVSAGATVLEPLGTVFISLMFCVVIRESLSNREICTLPPPISTIAVPFSMIFWKPSPLEAIAL